MACHESTILGMEVNVQRLGLPNLWHHHQISLRCHISPAPLRSALLRRFQRRNVTIFPSTHPSGSSSKILCLAALCVLASDDTNANDNSGTPISRFIQLYCLMDCSTIGYSSASYARYCVNYNPGEKYLSGWLGLVPCIMMNDLIISICTAKMLAMLSMRSFLIAAS